MLRIALIVVLSLFTSLAEAYPAQNWQVAPAYGGASLSGYSSATAACQALNAAQVAAANGGTSWTFNSVASTNNAPCVGTLVWNGGSNNNTSGGTVYNLADACHSGGTYSGGQCTCGAGETDTGTSCTPAAPTCPSAGTGMGISNFTVGWALSPTPGADDWVGGFMAPSTACQDSCGALVDSSNAANQSGTTSCWRGSTPEASGLYRMSCDYHIVSAGTGSCTIDPNAKNSPSSPAPTCPGTSGTFNGQPICLGVTGNNVQPPRQTSQGNPRAGTSPVDETNAEREPTSGNGGGPDARGGPGVTQGANGSVGTGSNSTPGSGGTGSNPTLELPTDYNREPTQQSILAELKKKRQIDETGVGDGKGVWDPHKTSMEAALDATKNSLDQLTLGNAPSNSSSDSRFSSWLGGSGSCSPIVFGNWVIDFCNDKGDWVRTFLAFCYSVIGLIYVFHRGNEAVQG